MRSRRASLSIHDVTPAQAPLIRRAWSLLPRWGLSTPPALLVVPNFHGRWPLSEHPDFVEELLEARRGGAELILHGLEHRAVEGGPPPVGVVDRLKARFLTAGEGEFQTLSYYQTAKRLRVGIAAFEEHLGERPRGFVAPAWLESAHTAKALKRLGFSFHEDHLFIEDLVRGRRRFAPAITFTGRSRARAAASIGWARAMELVVRAPGDLRLALHPVDFEHGDLVEAIGRLVEVISERRRWCSYAELSSGSR